jgi:hypothetical protein
MHSGACARGPAWQSQVCDGPAAAPLLRPPLATPRAHCCRRGEPPTCVAMLRTRSFSVCPGAISISSRSQAPPAFLSAPTLHTGHAAGGPRLPATQALGVKRSAAVVMLPLGRRSPTYGGAGTGAGIGAGQTGESGAQAPAGGGARTAGFCKASRCPAEAGTTRSIWRRMDGVRPVSECSPSGCECHSSEAPGLALGTGCEMRASTGPLRLRRPRKTTSVPRTFRF